MTGHQPTSVGWREWIGLPDWGVAHLKAKIDTGARTSALHAHDLAHLERDGDPWVTFTVHPWQGSDDDAVAVTAAVVDQREVRSSSGAAEPRPVVRTDLRLAGVVVPIEVTLTRRDEMGFRMLVGREALRGRFVVDPDGSYLGGHPPRAVRRRKPMTRPELAGADTPSPPPTRRRGRGTRPSFTIGDLEVRAGRRGEGELPVPRLVTGTRVSLPMRVVHGRHDGPTVWVSSSIHGDEVGGVEIIRRVNEGLDPRTLHGTVIMVPIVNVHGFLTGDRYLPDRRDLNRSFPGSANGSLASRIAHVFMDEVVGRCDVGIDLHTGSGHRTNLAQVRADLDDPTTRDLAEAFGAPVMLHARVRDGSLRAAGTAAGVTMLLFEGGEALRFDADAIRAGVSGIHRVLARLGMAEPPEPSGPATTPVASRKSAWIRARRSGITTLDVALGDRVARGDRVAVIHDSLGRRLSQARARFDGIVVGHTQHPLAHQGDALVHLARVEHADPDPADDLARPAPTETPAEHTTEHSDDRPATEPT